MTRHKMWIMIGLACALLIIPALHGLRAQNSTVMNYGEGQSGAITSDAALSFYTFEGAANDLVIVRVLGLTGGLHPAVTLFSPRQEQLATSQGNLLGLNTSEARLASRLPEDGVYTLVVSSMDGSLGDFLLLLDGRTLVSDEPLSDEAPAEILLQPDAPPQLFLFAANPDAPIVLNIAPEIGDFSYSIEVYDPNGNLLAILGGLPNAALTIPAGNGQYLIAVRSLNQTEGTLFISFSEGELPETGGRNLGGTGACMAVTGDSGVNIRSGPGLGYQIIGRLAAESSASIVGANGGWFAITYEHSSGNVGWVGASVVQTSGACGDIPALLDQPIVITATPTSTISPDDDDDDDGGSKPTKVPTDEATEEPTDEVTEEPEETPEATGEATSEATSEATAEGTAEVTPEV